MYGTGKRAGSGGAKRLATSPGESETNSEKEKRGRRGGV